MTVAPYRIESISIHFRDGFEHTDDLEYLNQYIRHEGIREIAYILFTMESGDTESFIFRLTRDGSMFDITLDTDNEDRSLRARADLWNALGNCGNLDVRLRDRIR